MTIEFRYHSRTKPGPGSSEAGVSVPLYIFPCKPATHSFRVDWLCNAEGTQSTGEASIWQWKLFIILASEGDPIRSIEARTSKVVLVLSLAELVQATS